MSSMSPLLGGVFMLELPLVWYASGQARSGGSAAGSAIDLVSYLEGDPDAGRDLCSVHLGRPWLSWDTSMYWWPGMEACWPSCRAGSHCGERVSWALRMERSGGHQLP